MKNVKSLVILTIALLSVVLFLGCTSNVNATSQTLTLPTNSSSSSSTTNRTTNSTTNSTTTTNSSSSNATLNTANTTRVNSTVVNNINNIPKTGENDTYVIFSIGIIALVIGSVAYIKSRKM